MAQNQLFLSYFQNATSEFDETWPKVGGYSLSLYDIGLYAGKTLDLETLNPLENNRIKKTKGF